MGGDKSRLRLGGRTFVEIVADALRPVAGCVSLISSRPDAASHALPVIADVFERRGAIGGLHAALARCEARWAFIVSCDLPFVTTQLLERLARLRGDETDAVAPLQDDGREQPLCALYAVATCRAMAEELISAGELRPRELLRRVRTRWVAFNELSVLAGSTLFFQNVNTPEEYECAIRVDEERGRGSGVGGR